MCVCVRVHLGIRLKEALVGVLRLLYCCRADSSAILEGYLHQSSGGGLWGLTGCLEVWPLTEGIQTCWKRPPGLPEIHKLAEKETASVSCVSPHNPGQLTHSEELCGVLKTSLLIPV